MKTEEMMNIEQIDEIAELLGQRKEASYCTMGNFGTNLLKMLMFLVGQSYESRTLNYECVKMVLEHIPATNFEYIKQMVLSFNQEQQKYKESQKKRSRLTDINADLQAKVELTYYWRQQAVFNQTMLMQNTPVGEATRDTIRMLDS
tara:strand:- start:2933 stop:3370 length:438 start_codon:yes stop_codon:yes gene_type:complete